MGRYCSMPFTVYEWDTTGFYNFSPSRSIPLPSRSVPSRPVPSRPVPFFFFPITIPLMPGRKDNWIILNISGLTPGRWRLQTSLGAAPHRCIRFIICIILPSEPSVTFNLLSTVARVTGSFWRSGVWLPAVKGYKPHCLLNLAGVFELCRTL